MPAHIRFTFTALCGISLSACASLTTYNKARYLPDHTMSARAIFIDAKQRAFISVPVNQTTTTYARVDGRTVPNTISATWQRFCAEPSPDALSALAGSASGDFSLQDKAKLGAAMSIAESAGSIGLRTQSIQLMRDSLYRVCEGAASGLLTSMQFETLQRRYQSSMVAILAIEQLTGAVRGPSLQLGSSGSKTGTQAVADLADKTAKARAAATKAKEDLLAKSTAATTANDAASKFLKDRGVDSADKLPAADQTAYTPLKEKAAQAEKDKGAATATQTAADADLKNYEAAMTAVSGGDLSAAATAAGAVAPLSDQSTAAVASAVEKIVSQTLNLGFLREGCATLFVASMEGRSLISPTDNGLAKSCQAYFDETVKALGVDTQFRSALAKVLAEVDPTDTAALQAIAKIGASQQQQVVAAPAFMAGLPPQDRRDQ